MEALAGGLALVILACFTLGLGTCEEEGPAEGSSEQLDRMMDSITTPGGEQRADRDRG